MEQRDRSHSQVGPCQRQNGNVDPEALAFVFGVTKFYAYLYGRKFKLITDHKPLVSIFHPSKELPHLSVSQIGEETRKESEKNELWKYLRYGLPVNMRIPFGGKTERFSIQDDCIFVGQKRVHIPWTLRTKVLQELHEGPQGIVKTKALARSYVWWPGVDSAIEKMIQNCGPCQRTRNNPPQQTSEGWDRPEKPVDRVHIDYAGPI
jgi:hypothetical protein